MAEKASGGVQSVERVFELLELITDAGGDVTLSELSSSTDLPLPTIHRLLRTLVSLGYIRQLPNRRYALGPRLIRLGEGASKQQRALVNAIVTLARNLDLTVVAEGIEDAAQRALLERMGCPYGQGFLFARPVWPAEIPALLASVVVGV